MGLASTRLESFRPVLRSLLVVVWTVSVGFGMKMLLDYQARPGEPARAPARWPATSGIPRAAGVPALVLAAHPRCPCTRATLAELERVVAATRGGLEVTVLFVIPPGLDPAWAHVDLWQSASSIPGVRVVEDRGGLEARRFGARTSGQALLFDAGGALVFAGGITRGRGHEGDNAGRDAIVSLVLRHSSARVETPVYGCPFASAVPGSPGSSGFEEEGRRCRR